MNITAVMVPVCRRNVVENDSFLEPSLVRAQFEPRDAVLGRAAVTLGTRSRRVIDIDAPVGVVLGVEGDPEQAAFGKRIDLECRKRLGAEFAIRLDDANFATLFGHEN